MFYSCKHKQWQHTTVAIFRVSFDRQLEVVENKRLAMVRLVTSVVNAVIHFSDPLLAAYISANTRVHVANVQQLNTLSLVHQKHQGLLQHWRL